MASEQETWECQTESTIFIYKKDRRTGDWKPTRVGGSGSQRIRLSADEREYNQELIPEENAHLDPFKSGRLIRVDKPSEGIVTRQELVDLIALEEADFREVVEEIEDELTIRRLLEVAATDGRMWQVEILRDVVQDRYSVAKSQKTVLDLMQSPDGALDEVVTQ